MNTVEPVGDYREEIFKDIEGYEDLYQISNKGNVYSKKSKRIKKPGIDKDTYLYVNLYKEGKAKYFRIHRLVALHFIENPENKPQVDHMDNNKQNNCIENLRWCDQRENEYNKSKQKSKNGKECSSKYKGVCWDKYAKKWRVKITINGKRKHLGMFETEGEAYQVYKAKAQEIHGEFFRE